MTTKTFEETSVLVPVEEILDNPYQPATRLNIDEPAVKETAESIRQHGLIHPIICRRNKDGQLEVADGYIRLSAFRLLKKQGYAGYDQIPVIARDLYDQQMADYVIVANTQRKGLTPVEEAECYKRYLAEFPITQAELGKMYGISQGEVANKLRLLEAPEPIKQAVISRKITETHARLLIKLSPLPERQEYFLGVAEKVPVSQLDLDINRDLFGRSVPLTPGNWNSPIFDTAECNECPSRMMVADPWGSHKKEPRCLGENCWNVKQKAAERARIEELAKSRESKVDDKKVLTANDINHSEYEILKEGTWTDYKKTIDTPSQCETCLRRAKLKRYAESKDILDICLDPKCYRAKKTKRTREENKSNKQKDRELTLRVGEIAERATRNRRGALVLAAWHMLSGLRSAGDKDLMAIFPDLPNQGNQFLSNDKVKKDLVNWNEAKLIKFVVAAAITHCRRNGEEFSTKLEGDAKLEVSIIEGTHEPAPAGPAETPLPLVTTTPPLSEMNPETQSAVVELVKKAAEQVSSPHCRQCGCTEEHACTTTAGRGCYWVEPDLCSCCAGQDIRVPDLEKLETKVVKPRGHMITLGDITVTDPTLKGAVTAFARKLQLIDNSGGPDMALAAFQQLPQTPRVQLLVKILEARKPEGD